MKLSDKIRAASSILKVRFMNRRIPLAVRWQLTNRCTSKCAYCSIWKTRSEELTTEQIFSLLDELRQAGTMVISFSGGDPLLREDIGKIIDRCKNRGIRPEINTNGSLVPRKIEDLKNLDLLKLSLDGPEEIHDNVRRHGSYAEVMEAAGILKTRGNKFTFATTLTKHNIGSIDFMLDKAREFNTVVAFQPLKRLYRGVEDMTPISPQQDEYRRAIERLITYKKQGNRHIRNSLIELEHIIHWPNYRPLKCWAGRIFCIIETNGDLFPCDRPHYNARLPNCLESGFATALHNLPGVSCGGCGFCGTLELNFIMSFRLSVLRTVKNLIN